MKSVNKKPRSRSGVRGKGGGWRRNLYKSCLSLCFVGTTWHGQARGEDGLYKIEQDYLCRIYNINPPSFRNGAKSTIVFGNLEQIFLKLTNDKPEYYKEIQAES